MSEIAIAANGEQVTEHEQPLRWVFAKGKIGLPTLPLLLRSLFGVGLWVVMPPGVASLLHRLHALRLQHQLERWWARRMVKHLRIQLDIAGLEHIDRAEQYIVTPLHEGFADVIALLHLPLDLRFAARDELFQWDVLGPYLRRTEHISLSPEAGVRGYRQLLRSSKQLFKAGESLVIFPQGTILGIESEFKAGAFALARALCRPILPVAVTGSHRVWDYPYTPRLRYGERISMRVLPPVMVGRGGLNEIEHTRRTVQRRLKALALSGMMAEPRRFVPQRDGYWDGYDYCIDPAFVQLAAEIDLHRVEVRTAR